MLGFSAGVCPWGDVPFDVACCALPEERAVGNGMGTSQGMEDGGVTRRTRVNACTSVAMATASLDAGWLCSSDRRAP
jgi:hypothetical protein